MSNRKKFTFHLIKVKDLKTHLLYILSYLPSFVKNEISALKDSGVKVTVILLGSATDHAQLRKVTGGLPDIVYVTDAQGSFKMLVSFFADAAALLKNLRMDIFGKFRIVLSYLMTGKITEIKHLRRAIRAARFSVGYNPLRIHTHFAWNNASVAAYTALLLGVPFSLTVHANDIFALNRNGKKRLIGLFEKADRIITISEFNKDYLIKRYGKSDSLAGKIKVIHCGVFTELFSFLEKPKSPEGKFRVVTLPSGFVEKKGFLVLIKAIKILSDYGVKIECLVIGGDGKGKRKNYESEADQLGIHSLIKFLGPVHQMDIPEIYKTCDAFVLPCVIDSKGKMDGIPVSLMEAMAIGIPVVSTNVSGIPELIEHKKTGFLAKPGNPVNLAKQLVSLMREKDGVNVITKAAREKIESEFDIKKNTKKLYKVLFANHG